MKRTMWLRLMAVTAALALVAAACATDEEPDEAEPDTDTEEPEPEADDEEPEPTDGEGLRMGYVLPETGPLAFLAPAQIRATEMAIAEAEEAGGVLGQPIELLPGDEAGDAAIASESADRLLAEGVHGIVGAAASGMSLAIIDQITGAGVVQCSASNTAPTFTDYDDGGYYFRTAPSDALQGPVLAEIVLEDGHVDIALLGRADDYGVGLISSARDVLEESGANVVYFESYDPEQSTFDAEVSEIVAAGPDAVIIVPFDEGFALLSTLIEQGVDVSNVYGADGIRSEELNEQIDPENPNVVDGFKGTAPNPGAVPGFLDRLADFAPDLEVTVFGPQAYDCAMWIMLAAEAAGSVDPADIQANMLEVTRGDNECSGFAECSDLLAEGESISYQFVSGIDGMSDTGEPINGSYEVWAWEDGELVSLEVREISSE